MAYAAITKPSSYMNPKIFTGTGSSNAITGVGFQPDLVWAKARVSGASTNNHELVDVVRAVTKVLSSNRTVGTQNEPQSITAFGADGFTLGTSGVCNQSGIDGVAWCWKAGTTTGIAGSPSITPTGYSFNATSGFSIIEWTGTEVNATLPHGLGVAPKMVIAKSLATGAWYVYSEAMGNTKTLFLNTDDTPDTNSAYWNDTSPTTTLFSVGSNAGTNDSGESMIAYCFADVKGFSKFSSYTGNGNADGTFVYTGFKPAFFLLKRTNTSQKWILIDNKREGYNSQNDQLYPTSTDPEGNGAGWFDIVSNGIKFRNGDNEMNGSGDSYIYMAFASEPLVSNVGSGIPATAR